MKLVKQKAKQRTDFFSRLTNFSLQWGIVAIFVVAPFYAPLTVWLASHVQHFDFLKIWKEIALTALGVILLIFSVAHYKQIKSLFRDKLFLSFFMYICLTLVVGAFDLLSGRVARDAVIYGLLINVRLIGFFALTFLSVVFKELHLRFSWRKLVFIPAGLVIIFGLLQLTVLPKDVLTHIGYSKNTIVPYQTVDNRPDFVRVQSTLRGPNPLGAYLTLIIILATCSLLADKKARHRKQWALFIIAAGVVLFGTYSRSAWVGLALGFATILFARYRQKFSRGFLIACTVLGVVAFGTLFGLRHNYAVENVLFHSSQRSSSAESSNEQRTRGLEGGSRDVLNQPLGGGIGSAGPASRRNVGKPARIAENYFLQIGQEVGIIGLGLFLVINIILLARFWDQRTTVLGLGMLASLVGLTFINFVSHAWTDDTLAYVWWGLAGIALAQPVILNKKRKQNEMRT